MLELQKKINWRRVEYFMCIIVSKILNLDFGSIIKFKRKRQWLAMFKFFVA